MSDFYSLMNVTYVSALLHRNEKSGRNEYIQNFYMICWSEIFVLLKPLFIQATKKCR